MAAYPYARYRSEQNSERKKALSATSNRHANATVEDIKHIADAVIQTLEDDKAEELLVIDLEGKTSIADQMIIASGRSQRHVSALADHVTRCLKDAGLGRIRVEGLPNADWVLIDTGDLVIHLFRPEVRSFYNLERIWGADATGHRAEQS
ncbi:MAG: ribosome silencing factor [Pseudomonadota bacterium]